MNGVVYWFVVGLITCCCLYMGIYVCVLEPRSTHQNTLDVENDFPSTQFCTFAEFPLPANCVTGSFFFLFLSFLLLVFVL